MVLEVHVAVIDPPANLGAGEIQRLDDGEMVELPGAPSISFGSAGPTLKYTSFGVRAGEIITVNANQVFKWTADGSSSVVAGSPVSGYDGDGAPATDALLSDPAGVSVWGSALFIADSRNAAVRRVCPDGIITTGAGTGETGPVAGDGGEATEATLGHPADVVPFGCGRMYVLDGVHRRIRLVEGEPD